MKRIDIGVTVETMKSGRGNYVPNQVIIYKNIEGSPPERWFISYGRKIAVNVGGKIYLDHNYWDYSRTTGKYRNEFLREGIETTRSKITSGEYELAELN